MSSAIRADNKSVYENNELIQEVAALEYDEDADEVAAEVENYVSQFDSLGGLRDDLSSRNHVNDGVALENIYSGGGLNCSTRTVAQVAYAELNGGTGKLNVQYDPVEICGLQVGNISTNNHICYQSPSDMTPFDWSHSQSMHEEFEHEDIIGLRAVNLLTESSDLSKEKSLRNEVRELEKSSDSEFLDGMTTAMWLDTTAEQALPESLSRGYDVVTDKVF